jgi:hypothetical protein
MKRDGKKNRSVFVACLRIPAGRSSVVDCCNAGPQTGQRFRCWLRAPPQLCEHANPCGMMDCSYNYVVTAQKPSNVTHSTVGHFTSPQDINLIISCAAPHRPTTSARASPCFTRHTNSPQPCSVFRKCTRIEIHTLTPDGLQVRVSRCSNTCITADRFGSCLSLTRPLLASRAWQTCRCMAASPPWSSSARRRAHSLGPGPPLRDCLALAHSAWSGQRAPDLPHTQPVCRGAPGRAGRPQDPPPRQAASRRRVQSGAARLSALRAGAGRGQGPALHLHGALQVLPAGVGQRHGRAAPAAPSRPLSTFTRAPRLTSRSCACLRPLHQLGGAGVCAPPLHLVRARAHLSRALAAHQVCSATAPGPASAAAGGAASAKPSTRWS